MVDGQLKRSVRFHLLWAAVLVLVRWPSVLCVVIDSERFADAPLSTARARGGRICQALPGPCPRRQAPA
jgi:hypothetical protein